MEIVILFMLLLPVISSLMAVPLALVVHKVHKSETSFLHYILSFSIWPYTLYLSLFPLQYALMLPEKLFQWLFPEPISSICVLLTWLMSILLEACFFYVFLPPRLSRYKIGKEPLLGFGIALIFVAPYIAALVHFIKDLL